jgi:hypothetical protein
MKSLMLSSFVAVALLAALAIAQFRPTSTSVSLGAAAMPSLLELHAAADVHKIPTEEIEDQSLVFATKPR